MKPGRRFVLIALALASAVLLVLAGLIRFAAGAGRAEKLPRYRVIASQDAGAALEVRGKDGVASL